MNKKPQKFFYVVGGSTQNSLSPVIFNYWFKKNKLNCLYKTKTIKKKNFKNEFIKLMKLKKFGGANITTPFKQRVLKTINGQTAHAKKISAINCVYQKGNKKIGTNTDWEGFIKSFKYQNKRTKSAGKIAAIIGFGGAARGLVYALEKMDYKKIIIFVRNEKKLNIFLKQKNKIKGYNIFLINNYSKKFDLLINASTTSETKDLKIDLKKLNKRCIVSDINYRPHKTDLIKSALKQKLKVNYGIYMLVFQAVPAFKHWFGFAPKITTGLLTKIKKEMKN